MSLIFVQRFSEVPGIADIFEILVLKFCINDHPQLIRCFRKPLHTDSVIKILYLYFNIFFSRFTYVAPSILEQMAADQFRPR